MSLAPEPRHRTLSLMPTYRCNAACTSCGTLSNPHVSTCLDELQVEMAIREAQRASIGLVVFTGGEATLEPTILFRGLRLAHELGMLTRLVTNAHWATSDAVADAYLRSLAEVNLTEINFSTGDQHARFVPELSVLRAVRAALRVGLTPAVMVETTAVRRVSKDSLERHAYQQETRRLFPGRLVKFSESPWMPLRPGRYEKYPPGMAVNAGNLSRTTGCDSVIQTTTVQANGSIGACCGLGMRLIPEMQQGELGRTSLSQAIDDAEADWLKRWIRLEGPERILAWAAGLDSSIQWENMYAHRCQACLRLYKDPAVRTVIAEHWQEKLGDIIFGEYLLYHLPEPNGLATSDIDVDSSEAKGLDVGPS